MKSFFCGAVRRCLAPAEPHGRAASPCSWPRPVSLPQEIQHQEATVSSPAAVDAPCPQHLPLANGFTFTEQEPLNTLGSRCASELPAVGSSNPTCPGGLGMVPCAPHTVAGCLPHAELGAPPVAGCPTLCLHPVPQPRKHPGPEIHASDPLCFFLSEGISAVTLLLQKPAASALNYKALHFRGQALAGFGGARHCLRRLQRNFRRTPAAGHPWQLSPGRLQEEGVGPC